MLLSYTPNWGTRLWVVPVLTVLCLGIPLCPSCQTKDPQSSSGLQLFLDCDQCDFSYFRRNVQMVNFVRAPQLADVQVLVTDLSTGADGRTYYFAFTGTGDLAEINYKITYTAYAYNTDVEVRDGLLKTLQAGLLPFLATHSSLDQVEIDYLVEEDGEEETLTSNPDSDPWNYWVFEIDNSGSFNMQESQMSTRLFSEVNADRITEKFKFRSGFRYSVTLEEFKDDDATIKSRLEFMRGYMNFVYSLGPRWSLGAFPRFTASTFSNLNYQFRSDFGIEYNLFPWDWSDRKVFTLSYRVGPIYQSYIEETIFDQTSEFLGRQQLRVDFVTRQNWGTIQFSIRGSSFLHDLSKYRISANMSASVRLTKVLSVFLAMEGESIHDQLSLPKGDLSREDILLELRQLETNYFYGSRIGFSLTFGSIYNNVVNPRF